MASIAAPSNYSSSLDVSQSPYSKATIDGLKAQNPQWQQTMLRIKDPVASLAFYKEHFGMTLCQEIHFGEGQGDFSLYFLTTINSNEEPPPAPGTSEAHSFLWDAKNGRAFLELTHNHGTEKLSEDQMTVTDTAGRKQVYHHGNTTPRGFGHIAFNALDVYAVSEKLEAAGVPFKVSCFFFFLSSWKLTL
jgi:lactoylglutathione lyase